MSENEQCSKCNRGMMRLKSGKNGQFLACEQYPECKNTENVKPHNTVIPTNGKDKLIIRQCCLKAAVERASNSPEYTIKRILEIAGEFEAWVNR